MNKSSFLRQGETSTTSEMHSAKLNPSVGDFSALIILFARKWFRNIHKIRCMIVPYDIRIGSHFSKE